MLYVPLFPFAGRSCARSTNSRDSRRPVPARTPRRLAVEGTTATCRDTAPSVVATPSPFCFRLFEDIPAASVAKPFRAPRVPAQRSLRALTDQGRSKKAAHGLLSRSVQELAAPKVPLGQESQIPWA